MLTFKIFMTPETVRYLTRAGVDGVEGFLKDYIDFVSYDHLIELRGVDENALGTKSFPNETEAVYYKLKHAGVVTMERIEE